MIKITLNEAKILLCFLNFLYSRKGQLPQDKKDILNSDELGHYFDLLDEPYNIVEQRIKVISKRESEGAYKLDKEGKPIADPATGELKKWEDSYYVTFIRGRFISLDKSF